MITTRLLHMLLHYCFIIATLDLYKSLQKYNFGVMCVVQIGRGFQKMDEVFTHMFS